ncbi:phosphatase PAP2 family protein [Phaeobacter sp. HF9A]|uniref:phosphatase PAP2 family protein n=1 Tax=Phaeobacter sp. HF9A TaxID=2721561 RepID=UPI00142F9E02|nr:phosphatase PAP2 family protein [Phaeobacter sp. HF9A]NIZ13434.1 phosphatase PAP2 family protein [Phaeobacter sp. HF9A]
MSDVKSPVAGGVVSRPGPVWRLLRHVMRQFGLFVMLSVFLVSILLSQRTAETIGDNIQIALPLTGLGCAVAEGRGVQYFGRFLLMELAIHGSKTALGDAEINQRPNGSGKGFPSGHTTAAAFGATALIQGCLAGNKSAQAATVIAAGYVGTSRVEAGAHTIWQVLAGAVLGWILQAATLAAFDRAMARLWSGAGRGAAVLRSEMAIARRRIWHWLRRVRR